MTLNIHPDNRFTLFCVDILPVLTYASGVWHPNRDGLRKLQRLERNCFKWLDHRQSYHQLLQKNHLVPISFTLHLQDLLLFQKLTFGLYDFPIWNFLSFSFLLFVFLYFTVKFRDGVESFVCTFGDWFQLFPYFICSCWFFIRFWTIAALVQLLQKCWKFFLSCSRNNV